MSIDVESTYRRYGPMVLRRCRALLKDEEKAVDAMHDVFVQLCARPGLPDRGVSSLLFTTATNVCLNRLRGERRRPEDVLDDTLLQIAGSDDLEDRSAARRMLDRIFGREPASTRTLAVLHLVDGMTLEETAAEVGLSVSGVRKRLRTLKARLASQTEVSQ